MSTTTTAFALREGDADDFAGGVLARHDGSSYDLAEELEKGKGTIVVGDDPQLVALLDAVPVLKRTTAPAKAKPKPTETTTTGTGSAGQGG